MCAWVSVQLNGSTCNEFRMERGLRQGCPLSPLLFNLVSEAFPTLVNQFKDNRGLKGMCIQGVRERTTIFQYMNDTILFLGQLENLEVILCIVTHFLYYFGFID